MATQIRLDLTLPDPLTEAIDKNGDLTYEGWQNAVLQALYGYYGAAIEPSQPTKPAFPA